ncbi:MAG: protein-disulfide reductase DsbD family protein [Bacteroidales bacterium]|nr:protein-disulfide reductase DsbD family protein [Bacteroidales bacterium]
MRRIVMILTAALAVVLGAAAQNPIRWRMSVKMTDETCGVITVRALVGEGWHLYGTSLPENGPRPTRFEFAVKGVTLEGKLMASQPTVTRHDPMFDMDLNWWDSNVTFTQKFRLDRRDGAAVSLTVTYMGCNDKNCLPPKSETLTYNFKQ